MTKITTQKSAAHRLASLQMLTNAKSRLPLLLCKPSLSPPLTLSLLAWRMLSRFAQFNHRSYAICSDSDLTPCPAFMPSLTHYFSHLLVQKPIQRVFLIKRALVLLVTCLQFASNMPEFSFANICSKASRCPTNFFCSVGNWSNRVTDRKLDRPKISRLSSPRKTIVI